MTFPQLGFLEDTTQLDELVPRLRQAYINATGGTGKGSDVNFSRLQAELDSISRENILNFKTPPFFTVIIRSLTILEGFALSVDPNFRLVRGAYPYVLQQLLTPEGDENTPEALRKLLVRLLTVNGEGKNNLHQEEPKTHFHYSEILNNFFLDAKRRKLNGNVYEIFLDLHKRQGRTMTHPMIMNMMMTKQKFPDKLLIFSFVSSQVKPDYFSRNH